MLVVEEFPEHRGTWAGKQNELKPYFDLRLFQRLRLICRVQVFTGTLPRPANYFGIHEGLPKPLPKPVLLKERLRLLNSRIPRGCGAMLSSIGSSPGFAEEYSDSK